MQRRFVPWLVLLPCLLSGCTGHLESRGTASSFVAAGPTIVALALLLLPRLGKPPLETPPALLDRQRKGLLVGSLLVLIVAAVLDCDPDLRRPVALVFCQLLGPLAMPFVVVAGQVALLALPPERLWLAPTVANGVLYASLVPALVVPGWPILLNPVLMAVVLFYVTIPVILVLQRFVRARLELLSVAAAPGQRTLTRGPQA